MIRYFEHLETPQEIKAHWRELCMKNHPDKGGDLKIMQQINVQYHIALEKKNCYVETGTDNKEHTYHYSQAVEQAVIDKIDALLKLKTEDISIWLIGTWIWIEGNTKPYKEQFKELGLRWQGKRQKWYWRKNGYRKRGDSKSSFEDLKNIYGANKFEKESKGLLVA